MTYTNYAELRSDLMSGKTTCKKVVEDYLAQINKTRSFNIYLEVFTSQSLKQAEELDKKRQSGKPLGRLFGMPIAIKDIIAMKGELLTCGSKMLETYRSPYNATAIERLAQEDAIFIGKVNMDEFAMGSSNENSAFGPVKNPLNPDYVPGGSSGGSAAAVAMKTCLSALGSDTGGSVRQPASFCNIIGFKPTYGRVSRYGLVAFASSFDQIGILANHTLDAALVCEVISGKDEKDATSSHKPVPNYSSDMTHPKSITIGIPKEFFTDDLNTEIRDLVLRKIDALKATGARVIPISLPHISYSLATYYILTTAEASSNLARYDGVRYGYRNKEAKDLTTMYVTSRSHAFGKEVKRRIMLGTYVLSSGYYDAYYKKAQQVRTLIQQDFLHAFNDVDVIACPTSPCFPFKFGDKTTNPIDMYLADIYTVGVNLAGLPAVSAPAGFGKDNLPAGIQFIGKPFDETTIFAISHLTEQLP